MTVEGGLKGRLGDSGREAEGETQWVSVERRLKGRLGDSGGETEGEIGRQWKGLKGRLGEWVTVEGRLKGRLGDWVHV